MQVEGLLEKTKVTEQREWHFMKAIQRKLHGTCLEFLVALAWTITLLDLDSEGWCQDCVGPRSEGWCQDCVGPRGDWHAGLHEEVRRPLRSDGHQALDHLRGLQHPGLQPLQLRQRERQVAPGVVLSQVPDST